MLTVTGGDTKEERIVLEEIGGLDGLVRRLGRGVHLGEDLLGEGLGDLEDLDLATSGLDTSLDGLSELGDVACSSGVRLDIDERYDKKCCAPYME